MRPEVLPLLVVALGLGASLGGCRGQTSSEPPIGWIRNMHELPRYDPQDRSHYFEDGRTMRPPVEGTVAREMEIDPRVDTGLDETGEFLPSIPENLVRDAGGLGALATRGQERYGIYCGPCHGDTGVGDGMVPTVSGVGAIRPPTFHDERVRGMPDGQLYATIRNGVRQMPAYYAQVPVRDRWAIVAYVRALQLSQMDERTAMNQEPTR